MILFSQYCNGWCPGAFAPGHHWLHDWSNISLTFFYIYGNLPFIRNTLFATKPRKSDLANCSDEVIFGISCHLRRGQSPLQARRWGNALGEKVQVRGSEVTEMKMRILCCTLFLFTFRRACGTVGKMVDGLCVRSYVSFCLCVQRFSFNSLWHSGAKWPRRPRLLLEKTIVYLLCGAKTLPEPMLTYCQLVLQKQISVKYE